MTFDEAYSVKKILQGYFQSMAYSISFHVFHYFVHISVLIIFVKYVLIAVSNEIHVQTINDCMTVFCSALHNTLIMIQKEKQKVTLEQ